MDQYPIKQYWNSCVLDLEILICQCHDAPFGQEQQFFNTIPSQSRWRQTYVSPTQLIWVKYHPIATYQWKIMANTHIIGYVCTVTLSFEMY